MSSPFFIEGDTTTGTMFENNVPARLQPANLRETVEDIVGGMFPGATYNDTLGTISLPSTSAAVGFADVRLGNGDGITTSQLVSAGTFTTVGLNTEISDVSDRFNTATGIYTCAAQGLYVINARVRVVDAAVDGRNIGLGVHTANSDGIWFQWFKVATSGTGGRWAAAYARTALFAAGDQLRLYMYSDGGQFPINAAGMTVTYLGA